MKFKGRLQFNLSEKPWKEIANYGTININERIIEMKTGNV